MESQGEGCQWGFMGCSKSFQGGFIELQGRYNGLRGRFRILIGVSGGFQGFQQRPMDFKGV